jgi:anti-sigma B factor antagonist
MAAGNKSYSGVNDMYTKGPVIVMELPENLNHLEGTAFLAEVKPLLESDRPRMVLDCSQVQQIDSAGIEVLLECMEQAMKRDGDLKLAALSPSCGAILELMRVDRLFEVFETAEEAARSFRAIAAPELAQTMPWYSSGYGIGDLKTAS